MKKLGMVIVLMVALAVMNGCIVDGAYNAGRRAGREIVNNPVAKAAAKAKVMDWADKGFEAGWSAAKEALDREERDD